MCQGVHLITGWKDPSLFVNTRYGQRRIFFFLCINTFHPILLCKCVKQQGFWSLLWIWMKYMVTHLKGRSLRKCYACGLLYYLRNVFILVILKKKLAVFLLNGCLWEKMLPMSNFNIIFTASESFLSCFRMIL